MPKKILVTVAILLASCASTPKAESISYRASVSVQFDRQKLSAEEVHGSADPFVQRRLTAGDPVRIASISKLVTALGVMRLVEAGTLDLDRDVSDWLGWRMRNPAFAGVPITLRMLLSHQSSLTDAADYVIPLGETVQARLQDPRAWDAEHKPGSYFRYTNLNFPVVASVMERATGERFDRLMARLVFVPLKLDACMNWTSCSDGAVARAVVLTDQKGVVQRDDLKRSRPACPVVPAADGTCDLARYELGSNGALFSPQGGVRISMRDLAAIGQMLLRGGNGFLSPVSIATLVGPHWNFDGTNGFTNNGFDCTYGLAVQTLATPRPDCRDDPYGDGRRRVGHSGEAYGLRSGLWLDMERKTGIAFFVTAVPEGTAKGASAFTAIEEEILRRAFDRPHK